jgi:hypothetical protein
VTHKEKPCITTVEAIENAWNETLKEIDAAGIELPGNLKKEKETLVLGFSRFFDQFCKIENNVTISNKQIC